MDFVSFGRSGDCVFYLEQDNVNRCIRILDFNQGAEMLFCYSKEELCGQNLNVIFDEKGAELLESYLSYEEGNFDLVMSKMKDFVIKAKNGRKIKVIKKVFLVKCEDDRIYYELLLRKIGFAEGFKKFCYSFENYKPPEIGKETGLMLEESALREIDMMVKYSKDNKVNVVVCLVEFPSLNCAVFDSLFEGKVKLLKEIIRKSDVIAHADHNKILLFLTDCSLEDSGIACKRIKEALLRNSPDVLIGYLCVDDYSLRENLMEDLEKQVNLMKA